MTSPCYIRALESEVKQSTRFHRCDYKKSIILRGHEVASMAPENIRNISILFTVIFEWQLWTTEERRRERGKGGGEK